MGLKGEIMANHDIPEIFDKFYEKKQFDSLKKHFHAYTKGFKGAKDLRERLMKVKNSAETKRVIEDFLKSSG